MTYPPESWLDQHNAKVSAILAQERIEKFVREQLGANDND